MVAMGGSLYFLDHFSVVFTHQNEIPGDLRALFEYISVFGHGTGCLFAVLLIWNLDSKNRTAIKLVLGATISAGILSTFLKVLFNRARPNAPAEIANADMTLVDSFFQNAGQSFPSGHTATAFALAGTLALIYPKGKWMFFSFAILTGVQRIISHNHFPSDVFAGAAIGILAATTANWIWCRNLESNRCSRHELTTPRQPSTAKQPSKATLSS